MWTKICQYPCNANSLPFSMPNCLVAKHAVSKMKVGIHQLIHGWTLKTKAQYLKFSHNYVFLGKIKSIILWYQPGYPWCLMMDLVTVKVMDNFVNAGLLLMRNGEEFCPKSYIVMNYDLRVTSILGRCKQFILCCDLW